MTIDKKQPPVGVPCFVRMKRDVNGEDGDFIYVARWAPVSLWSLPGIGLRETDVVEWRECIPWDRLDILDRYDEERKDWEAQIADLTDGMNSAIAHAVVERKELSALRSQVTALTEERDAALRAYEDANQQLFKALARADRAEKERDAARAQWRKADSALADEREAVRIRDEIAIDTDEAREIIEKYMQPVPPPREVALADVVRTICEDRLKALLSIASVEAERDRAIAERDDLGCQLEALRAVQRDDMQVLLWRVAGLEKWRAECDLADQAVQVCIANAEAEEARLRRDDEKGGA